VQVQHVFLYFLLQQFSNIALFKYSRGPCLFFLNTFEVGSKKSLHHFHQTTLGLSIQLRYNNQQKYLNPSKLSIYKHVD
jgi:hypothetical protein